MDRLSVSKVVFELLEDLRGEPSRVILSRSSPSVQHSSCSNRGQIPSDNYFFHVPPNREVEFLRFQPYRVESCSSSVPAVSTGIQPSHLARAEMSFRIMLCSSASKPSVGLYPTGRLLISLYRARMCRGSDKASVTFPLSWLSRYRSKFVCIESFTPSKGLNWEREGLRGELAVHRACDALTMRMLVVMEEDGDGRKKVVEGNLFLNITEDGLG